MIYPECTGHIDLPVITPVLWVITIETCWACNPQCQEDSLYPHSLRKSPRYNLNVIVSDFHKPLSFAFTMPACTNWYTFESPLLLLLKTNESLWTGMWPGRWNCADWTIMVSHARLWLRSQIGDGVRWHIRDREAGFRLLEAKQTQSHKDLSLCVCSELWLCHLYDWITLAWHNTALYVLAWQGAYYVQYWNYQV